jgi:YegS/Rv2252/BmrU family lipid kinase
LGLDPVMAKRLLLIANPASGSPPRASVCEQALAGLAAAGFQVDLRVTKSKGHAGEMARDEELAGFDVLGVLGGDGTLHEVASGLLQRPQRTNIPLGLIPAGTGNSLGQSLGIADVTEGVRRIAACQSRSVDVLRVETAGQTDYCLNLIGWAAGQAITATAERMRWLGSSRYAAAALVHVLTARPRWATIVLDGEKIEDEFLLVLACNTKYVGSGMLAAPRAVIDDGLFDVVVVRRASRWRLLKLLQRVHDGSHVEMPEVECIQARWLRIETTSPEPLNLDGELKGTTPLEAEVLPGAITLLA